MNQTLQKLADGASKTYRAWQSQMRRDGFTKREQLSATNVQLSDMTPAARALFADYQKAQRELNHEACTCSQPDMFEEDESDGNKSLTVVSGGYPDPASVAIPDGLARRIVAPQMLADLRQLSAAATLIKAKPTAKIHQLDEMYWVVTSVAHDYVVLTRCLPEDQYVGTVVQGVGPEDDWTGLLFRSGPGKAASFVLLNSAQSIACVAGDPLADVGLSAEAK